MRELKSGMSGATALPVWSINASAKLPGLDFSDHRTLLDEGYDAIMVTDTAFYRNREYHGAGDTWDRLDYRRMADVVVGVYEGVKGVEIKPGARQRKQARSLHLSCRVNHFTLFPFSLSFPFSV